MDQHIPTELPKEASSDPNKEKTADIEATNNWDLKTENYLTQTKIWPVIGRHILAHFDDTSIVVYQAFKPSIAEFAVQNQRLGGPNYSVDRMSWIKTNFLWMMYRCGWAQKANQERVLALRITREGFEDILSKALTIHKQTALGISTKDVEVRLQWDPDHNPRGENLQRRAIQLGLKGKTLLNFTSTYIVNIKDITDFVHQQYHVLTTKGEDSLQCPCERIYIPIHKQTCQQIDLSEEK
ncbi:uncharacterized protein LOC131936593 [Physella acuta]|uniref:uncharacterized protein LOC131936593 n=1 Tax=Physella acuta TaxID=109671 RepID=UPI0027DD8D49|nr:uncharacterized protein LOC131936593 [Physella acuta]XP_059149633.1 uncharacterized protein LOC131936593 [Physella acuta]